MASSPESPLETSSAPPKSAAQRLQEEHEAAEAHRVTVEDVPDEEDIAHPPPSESTRANDEGAPLSAKAAGKQKVTNPVFEDEFPALGGRPNAQPAAGAPAWAAKAKASSRSNGAPNGTSTPKSSGTLTPNPAFPAPAASANVSIRPQQYGQAPRPAELPGKHRDSILLLNSQIDKTKPIQKLLQDIKRKSGVVITTEPGNYGQSTKFVGTGNKEAVHNALRQISRELTPSIKQEILIPAALKSHIIGKGGSSIIELEKKSGARIKVQQAGTSAAVGGDDLETATVEITGDAAAVGIARAAIEEQVKARPMSMNVRMGDIPPEFFPFIESHPALANARQSNPDVQIQVPSYHRWHQRPPRATASDQRPKFIPHPEMQIHINGERAAALEVKAEIERLAEELEMQLALEEQNLQRGQHQFIVGDRGISPEDFLRETGCIALLPPDGDNTEDIIIIGPPERLNEGVEKATSLAAAMSTTYLDPQAHITEASQGAESHARALAMYFQERQLEEELLQLHDAQISFPPASSQNVRWDIFSKEQKNLIKARNDLAKVVQAHPPARVNRVSVHPFYYPHLRKQKAKTFRDELGVHMILPQNGDPIILVHEGPSTPGTTRQIPRQRPTEAEIIAFSAALQQAQNEILEMTNFQEISERSFEVPRKFHDKVRKFSSQQQQTQPYQGFPVDAAFGTPGTAANQRGTAQRETSQRAKSQDEIRLQGPVESVQDLEDKIMAFIKLAEQDEKERGYTTSFEFPSKYNNYLIGKQGANINALREKYDVEIDTKENGKIQLKGPQKKAAECQKEILQMAKQWENEVTYSIIIEPQLHGEVIGKGGSNLTRIQEKGKGEVRIQFPRLSPSPDDRSVADTASEVGDSRKSRPAQAPNVVIIRGPRESADKVRDELLKLAQYVRDTSHTADISVAKEQVPALMGRGGREMEKLRAETGASIEVPNSQNGSGGEARVTIQIRGSKAAVDKAKSELQKKSKAFDDIVTRVLNVDKKHHQALIGGGGSNIRRIVTEAGGPENSAEAVKFPTKSTDSTEIRVQGVAAVVEKICAAIEEFAATKDSQVTESIEVPADKHRLLIGRGGDVRRNLELEFKVALDVPRNGSGRTDVKVSGGAPEVAKAIEHIANLTKPQAAETIMVPKSVHHIVSQNGSLFRTLRTKGVVIDHGGHQPPPKPQNGTARPTANDSVPLITDEPGVDNFSWRLVETEAPSDSNETIPWILTGKSEENVAAAKATIDQAVEAASRPSATGYLILEDPKLHRFIIGPGGSTIKEIRNKTKCEIQVPNNKSGRGGEGEAITITGSKAACEDAKELIWEAVQNGRSGGSRPASRA